MTEEERIENVENRGSYFLLYEWKDRFLIEPFNIPIVETIKPKHGEFNNPDINSFAGIP